MAINAMHLKAIISASDRLSPTLRSITKNIGLVKYKLTQFSSGGAHLSAGLVGAITASASAFAVAENAATGLQAAMMQKGGKVGPEFEKISAIASKLGNQLPGTTADFQNMMTVLQRQGMSAQAVIGGLGKATAYLAVQLQMPTDKAAEFAAKLQDATKTTERDAMGLFDVIQRSYYLGVNPDNMLQGFAKLSPALGILKKSGLEGAKALAPLLVIADQAAMSGEAAGNAYRKIFQGALDAEKIGKANKLLAGHHIKIDFTNGKGEFAGLKHMFATLDKLKGLNTQTKIAAIKTMFGDDAETLQAVSLLMDKNVSGYKEVVEKMASQASLQERVNVQLGTLSNLWEATKGTAENALVAVGKAYAPELKSLSLSLGDISERFQVWATENPKTIRSITAVAGAVAGVKVAAWGASIALGVLNGVLSMSPLGLVVTALAAGAAYVITNWETIGPVLKQTWQDLSNGLAITWKDTKGAVTGIANHINASFQESLDNIMGWFRDTEATIEGWASSISSTLTHIWDDPLGAGKEFFSWLGGKLQGIPGVGSLFGEGGAMPAVPVLPEQVKQLAEKFGNRYEINPGLIRAIIGAESGGNAAAVSVKGAKGLMQLSDATARRFGVSNPFDPAQNVRGGTAYLDYLLTRYNGDLIKSIAAYNAGEGNVDKYKGIPPFAETQAYVRKVLGNYQSLAKSAGVVDLKQYKNIAKVLRSLPPSYPSSPSVRMGDWGFSDIANQGTGFNPVEPADLSGYLAGSRSNAALDIRFENAPQGMRLTPMSSKDLPLNIKVGRRNW